MQIPEIAPNVQDSLLAICLFAAFADGEKSDEEREAVRKIADEMGSENLSGLSRQILMRKLPLEAVLQGLTGREDRMLAYEMALGVCETGGSVSSEEKEFLATLRGLLGLGESDSKVVEDEVATLALQPIESKDETPVATDHDDMILKYAILNGALELLPDTLATLAIVPLQMKMVYRIGKSHGVELDRTHIKEFLATAGIGIGSQVVEGFARKFMKKIGRTVGGKLAGGAASQLTGSAFSFATTYALGHAAEKYYSGGRKLEGADFRALFDSFQARAKELHTKYLPEIQERAGSLSPATILSMVTGSKGI